MFSTIRRRHHRSILASALGACALVLPATAMADVPVATTNPTISGTPVVGKLLTCAGATFTGDALQAPKFDWYRDDGRIVSTAETFVPTSAEADRQVRCRVTVANDSGETFAESRDVEIASGIPEAVQQPSITGKAEPGLAVTCVPGTWSGESVAFTYAWLLDGKPIAGATNARLLLLDAWTDKAVACRVTATSPTGSKSVTTKAVSPFRPPILAPLSKVQPKLPKLKAALASGIPSRMKCNTACTTLATTFMLETDARKLGITGKVLGGVMIVGQTTAKRTSGGELLVRSTFSASAKKGLAKAKGTVRIDLLFETAAGPKYSHKLYHVATGRTVKLKR